MQFCKVLSYKQRVFKIIYNKLFSLCRNTLTLSFELHTIIKRPKTRMCLKHITPLNKDNGNQK